MIDFISIKKPYFFTAPFNYVLNDEEEFRKYLPYGNDIPDFCKNRSSEEIEKYWGANERD